MQARALLPAVTLTLALAGPLTTHADSNVLNIETATIADLNAAFANGRLTSAKLVNAYLKRIEAYDKKGPAINAVILVNPRAMAEAKALDAERKSTGPRSPLHGVPIVLKDNFDTFDMPTTAGSMLLKGSIPPDDAFVVKKLRAAGAIIIAKPKLLAYGYDFEQATKARVLPKHTPPLSSDKLPY